MSTSEEKGPLLMANFKASAIIDSMRAAEEKVYEVVGTIDGAMQKLQFMREELMASVAKLSQEAMSVQFDEEKFREFMKHPYAIVSRRPDEYYVVSPGWTGFQVGWLEKSVKGWNYFIVNKYVTWLANVPAELKEKFSFKEPLPLKVFNDVLLTGEDHQDAAWSRYSKHLLRREGKDRIKIKAGHEFELIAELVNDGILPFMAQPLLQEDYRDVDVQFTLRKYQEEAWQKFKAYGMVGVYWPMGAGKTYIGLYALAHVKGPKLVVVPGPTLTDQWRERIQKYMPQYDGEIEIVTYQSFEKVRNKEYALVVFDEAHRLPANTFSKMATLRTRYRMGLSATPYREDGRTDYIITLTGIPVGMDWKDILAMGVISMPTVTLYITQSNEVKIKKVAQLLQDDKKTLIYSYWLDLGRRISEKFDIPFVYGDTKNRLDVLRSAKVSVVSSVGGEGLSLPDLERIIEVGFQFGSRREEAQLMGRLFHSAEDEPEHIILMTEEELNRYEKRLLAIYEKGFRVNIIR